MLSFLWQREETHREDTIPATGSDDGKRKLLPLVLKELGAVELTKTELECERPRFVVYTRLSQQPSPSPNCVPRTHPPHKGGRTTTARDPSFPKEAY